MLDLQPGETFRHLVTMYEEGRDSPRLDLSGVNISAINLAEAPWTVEILETDPTNGQFQLYIPDTLTRLADEYSVYPFQLRLTYPTGDRQFVGPINISTGAEFILGSGPIPPGEIVTLADLSGTFVLSEAASNPGDIAGAIISKNPLSVISLTDNAGGRVFISGTNIACGATPILTADGAFHNFTIREELDGATNSPHDTTLVLEVIP
jgi:hypothetical protein